MAAKVSLRTLTVFKHAMIGFGLGLVPAVISVMPPAHVTSRGALIGTIIGGALGGALALGMIGAYRARAIPADQPSPIGPVRLTLGCAPLVGIIIGLGVLAVL
ncbi:hypothetical protein [Nitrospirillum iridis]|uniref:Uncharacterized protein n=1 Tax=Nitrospirillum iridis TaxID=765888 RepID=A0A7X0B216_9PROT|nr:hypothetical protein [Nitrospirillum iridis]MBB6254329.1 hypothetical protein [Nitrospirillum iridis]